jgi:uncharacterized membrane protein YkoI
MMKMKPLVLLGTVLVVPLACAAGAAARARPPAADTSPYTPRITMAEAREKALKVVPGLVRAEELEFESGRWIYSFEIKPAGEKRRIIKEVNIDADTGDQVGQIQAENE